MDPVALQARGTKSFQVPSNTTIGNIVLSVFRADGEGQVGIAAAVAQVLAGGRVVAAAGVGFGFKDATAGLQAFVPLTINQDFIQETEIQGGQTIELQLDDGLSGLYDAFCTVFFLPPLLASGEN